jgi:hypothetical protein
MSVRVRGRLPKGELDGLQWVEGSLRVDERPRLVVAMVFPKQIARNVDDDENPYTITLGISSIEVLSGMDESAARALLSGAFEQRTGKAGLPFGTVAEHDVDSIRDLDPMRAFEDDVTSGPPPGVDPETGEISDDGDDPPAGE